MAKPTTSAIINTSNPLTTNLKAAFLLNEGAGTTAKDYVTGTVNLSLANGAAWSASGIVINAAGANASVTTPADLKMALPITLYFRMTPLANDPTDYVNYFGIIHNTAGSPPYVSITVDADDFVFTRYQVNVNDAGSFAPLATDEFVDTDVNTQVDLAVVFTTAGVKFYRNSVLETQNLTARSNPTYDSTSRTGFGNMFAGGTSNAKAEMIFGYLFNEELDTTDLAEIRSDPYALFSEPAPSGVTLTTIPKINESSAYRVDGRSSYLTYLKPKTTDVAVGPVSPMISGIRSNADDFSYLDLYP